MKRKSQEEVSVCLETLSMIVAPVDGCPAPSVNHTPVLSGSSFSQSMETVMDLQSCSMMEERYGIREEGLF